MCIGGGQYVYTDKTSSSSLVGWWTFDDKFGHDYSKHINTALNLPYFGPAMCKIYTDGRGASLFFNSSSMATIPHVGYYESSEFTITFWIYLTKDSTGTWRTILHKGQTSKEMTPTVMLWPKERRLHVRASTDYFWNEGLDSTGLILLRRWTHIGIIASGQLLQLYINGISDSQTILKAPIKWNKGDIYIGKDPWHMGFSGFFDELRIYNTALQSVELEAAGSPALPLQGNVRETLLGCQLCNYKDALSSCLDGYHMCSLEELYAGPYEVARTNGWFRFTSEIWTRNTKEQTTTRAEEMQDPDVHKVGLCCLDT